MRNLKKVLSLVLCVAMLLSVMVMGTGAAFTDEDDFSPQYAEAAEVLAGMKVMQGYDDGSFLPQRNITRAQVATMIYRAATSDVTDTQTPIYADYDKFDDVQSDDWFAGYVNYCGNAELIKGFTPTTFGPNKNVTGYQVLAMILRAVGYDANDEFTGSGWEIRTASTAQQLGMLDNVQEATLGQPATRELVAELIFQALNVNMVKYMPAAGYVKQDITLGQQEFELTNKGDNHDDWGRPGTLWTYKINNEIESTLVKEDALATYTTAVTECDVATDLDFDGTKTFTTYTNGEGNAKDYKVQATDTVGTIGAQGRITEVYEDEIVYIDTYLAKVTDVQDATFDKGGHLDDSSELHLDVYTATGKSGAEAEQVVLYGGETDYDYAEGDMILVSAVDNKDGKIALEANDYNEKDTPVTFIDRGIADSIVGAQTTIWNQTSKHTIDGETYDDASTFYLDEAKADAEHNYTWYFDQFGNLIGATEIEATYDYAVLKDIRWVVGAPGYAQATLIGMDGEEFTTKVSSLDGHGVDAWTVDNAKTTYQVSGGTGKIDGGKALIADDTILNTAYEGYALYRVSTDVDGVSILDGIGDKNATIISIANNAAFNTGNTTVATNAIVDNATIFIVNNDDGTYSRYVGKDAMFSYTAGQIFYVDADGDKVVDYVYVRDCAPVAASLDKLVMATGESYTGPLTDSENYWVLSNGIRGTETENGTIEFTKETPVKTMTGNVGILYIATYAENSTRIDSVTEVTSTAQRVDYTDDDSPNVIEIVYPIYAPGTGTLITGNSKWEIHSGYTTTYNVSNATVVGDYTSLSDVTNWADVNVFVVYTTEGSQNTASTVYVTDKVDSEQDGTVTPDPDYAIDNIALTKDGNNFKVSFDVASAVGGDGKTVINTTIYKVNESEGNGKVTSYQTPCNYSGNHKDAKSTVAVPADGNYYAVVELVIDGEVVSTATTEVMFLAK